MSIDEYNFNYLLIGNEEGKKEAKETMGQERMEKKNECVLVSGGIKFKLFSHFKVILK